MTGSMIDLKGRTLRRWALAGALSASVAAGGCGGIDGVELNGAIFDYMGVSTKATSGPKVPKMAQRPGIVVPPQLDRLPEPGSGEVARQDAWPADPDEAKAQKASYAEAQHAKFCKDALWKAQVAGDPRPIKGPLGPCQPSALTTLTGQNSLENLQAPKNPEKLPR